MKPRISVHKFSSCDGCQLAFLNMGEELLALAQYVDIVHFAEAGYLNEAFDADIAFVEGSVTTPHEAELIQRIRQKSKYLITIGACATSGGLQALRNIADGDGWMSAIYARPDYIKTLPHSTPIKDHVRVDFELWGCPINSRQVVNVVRSLLFQAAPKDERDKICIECKRKGNVCVLVAKGDPCMGPVTRTGCGALCPSFGRDCYSCYGPAENANAASFARCLSGLGLRPEEVGNRFLFINNGAEPFLQEGRRWREGENG